MSLISVLGIPTWVLIIYSLGMMHTGMAKVKRTLPCQLGQTFCQWNPYQPTSKKALASNLVWRLEDDFLTLQGTSRGKHTGDLIKDSYKANTDHCLSFSMQIYDGATLEVILKKGNNEEFEEEVVWSRKENNIEWHEARVNLPGNSDPLFLIIRGTLKVPLRQRINIKDIHIKKTKCPMETKEDSSVIHSCGFEEDFCKWEKTSVETGRPNWIITKGIQHLEYFGHQNYSRALGHFATVSPLPVTTESTPTIKMSSPQFSGEVSCLEVFYLLKGNSGKCGVFTISVEDSSSKKTSEIFKLSGSQGERWRETLLTLSQTSDYRIIIGFTPCVDDEVMAVDDITIKTGKCPGFDLDKVKTVSCRFESQESGCEFSLYPYLGEQFVVKKMLSGDLMTSEVLAVHEVTDKHHSTRLLATLTSEMYFTSSPRNCLIFNYRIQSDNASGLLVQTSIDNFISPRWYRRMSNSYGLRKGMVEVETANNYRIEFHTFIFPFITGFVAVDSYQLTNSTCPKNNNMCNFDTSTCGWQTDKTKGNLKWVRGTVASVQQDNGPRGDKSTYTQTGQFMFLNAADKQAGDSAWLTSKVFPAQTGFQCLSFWYHLFNIDETPLRAFVRPNFTSGTPTDPILLWEANKKTGRNWMYAQASVNDYLTINEFAISFVAFVGQKHYDTGIDEVNLEEGACETF